MVEPGIGGSGRLLTLRLNTTTGPVTLINALTLSPTPDIKDKFYENLENIIRHIPSKEQLILLEVIFILIGEICRNLCERVWRLTTWGLGNRQVGSSMRYHAPHRLGHLWEKDLKVT